MKKTTLNLLTIMMLATLVGCSGINDDPTSGVLTDNSSFEPHSSDSSSATSHYAENYFTDEVSATVVRRISEQTFVDFDGTYRSFEYLLDRQIGSIANGIISRLDNIYGHGNNYTYEYDGKIFNSWKEGTSLGEKYAVHQDGSMYYVFLYDEDGKNISSSGVTRFDEITQKWGSVVFYQSASYNNIDQYECDLSTMVLTAFLANNRIARDTYSEKNDYITSHYTIPYGSMYGENYYTILESEKKIGTTTDDSRKWLWADYFADGTAQERMKLVIAQLVVGYAPNECTSYSADISKVNSEYNELLDKIYYLGNYAQDFADNIKEFVTKYVVGDNLLQDDRRSKETFAEVKERYEEFCNTFEYCKSDNSLNAVLTCNLIDSDFPSPFVGNFYTLSDIYLEINLNMKTENIYLVNNTTNQTFSDEFDKLVHNGGYIHSMMYLSKYAMEEFYGNLFDYSHLMYYGENDSGYITDGVKAFKDMRAPFTPNEQAGMRNIYNYAQAVNAVVDAVANEKFDADIEGNLNTDDSVYLVSTRSSIDSGATHLSDISSNKNCYDTIAIHASKEIENIRDYAITISLDIEDDMKVEMYLDFVKGGNVEGYKKYTLQKGTQNLTLNNLSQSLLYPNLSELSKVECENGIILHFRVLSTNDNRRVIAPFSADIVINNTKLIYD